jgi:hypothetical protein
MTKTEAPKIEVGDDPPRCPHEKNVGRSSICAPAHRCDLDEGHAGKHQCDCGITWSKSSNSAYVEV